MPWQTLLADDHSILEGCNSTHIKVPLNIPSTLFKKCWWPGFMPQKPGDDHRCALHQKQHLHYFLVHQGVLKLSEYSVKFKMWNFSSSDLRNAEWMSRVFKEMHKTLRPNKILHMKRAFQHLTKDYSYRAKSGDDHRCTLQQWHLDLVYPIKVLCISLSLHAVWNVNCETSPRPTRGTLNVDQI